VNLIHRRLCRSDTWAEKVRADIIPNALAGVPLDGDVLELGPGPGRTTEVLLDQAQALTALEVDPVAARRLRARLGDRRLTVVDGDATAMPFPDRSFDVVIALTMLHHLPDPPAQDRLFAEAARVLRPGGVFAGSDGQMSLRFRVIHIADTLTPVEPAALPGRLGAAGFSDVDVSVTGGRLRFRARR
jgi:SAM-dependent methyltransferase